MSSSTPQQNRVPENAFKAGRRAGNYPRLSDAEVQRAKDLLPHEQYLALKYYDEEELGVKAIREQDHRYTSNRAFSRLYLKAREDFAAALRIAPAPNPTLPTPVLAGPAVPHPSAFSTDRTMSANNISLDDVLEKLKTVEIDKKLLTAARNKMPASSSELPPREETDLKDMSSKLDPAFTGRMAEWMTTTLPNSSTADRNTLIRELWEKSRQGLSDDEAKCAAIDKLKSDKTVEQEAIRRMYHRQKAARQERQAAYEAKRVFLVARIDAAKAREAEENRRREATEVQAQADGAVNRTATTSSDNPADKMDLDAPEKKVKEPVPADEPSTQPLDQGAGPDSRMDDVD
ncbi:MAG: hypothetical protein M1819_006122 [Sarea resinae]|nr:MAG: hypothetical protein M1819_006122 [Sarea resinae]